VDFFLVQDLFFSRVFDSEAWITKHVSSTYIQDIECRAFEM